MRCSPEAATGHQHSVRTLPALTQRAFPQPSTEQYPNLVTHNLDRGCGMQHDGTVRTDPKQFGSNSALQLRGRVVPKPLFLNILATSPVESRFCKLESISGPLNCKRISILPRTSKKTIEIYKRASSALETSQGRGPLFKARTIEAAGRGRGRCLASGRRREDAGRWLGRCHR